MQEKPELVEICFTCERDINEVKPQGLVMTGSSVVRSIPFKCPCGASYVWRPLSGKVFTTGGKKLPKAERIMAKLKFVLK